MSLSDLPIDMIAKIASNSDSTSALDLEAAVNARLFTDEERAGLKRQAQALDDKFGAYVGAVVALFELTGWKVVGRNGRGTGRGVKPTAKWVDAWDDSRSTLRWLASKRWAAHDGILEPVIEGWRGEVGEQWDRFFEETAWIAASAMQRELGIPLPDDDDDGPPYSRGEYLARKRRRVKEWRRWLASWQWPHRHALAAAFKRPDATNVAGLGAAAKQMTSMAERIKELKMRLFVWAPSRLKVEDLDGDAIEFIRYLKGQEEYDAHASYSGEFNEGQLRHLDLYFRVC